MNDEKFNWVPVVSSSGKPLMPCHPARARDLIRKGKAVPKWKKQLYYIQLVDRVDGDLQPVACGIDPGSKREGYTVKSATKTYLNINSHACGYVKDKVSFKRVMRKLRRSRHTPCRAKRSNRSRSLNFIPPSTRARWGLKLRISAWLSKFYPISAFVVEDIIYETIEGKNIRSNSSFSPLQVGKKWFYEQLSKLANVFTKVGRDTYNLRRDHGLIKTRLKMAEDFSAHCVDSWVLANWHTGGHLKPDNQTLMILKPIDYRRRQLHVATPVKGGCRRRYGGTMSSLWWVGIPRTELHSQTQYTEKEKHNRLNSAIV